MWRAAAAGTVEGIALASSDDSEELSLGGGIWCSTRRGGSDPALEELDSDTLRIAYLELRKMRRGVSECSSSDSELEDTYVCSPLDNNGGISSSTSESSSVE